MIWSLISSHNTFPPVVCAPASRVSDLSACAVRPPGTGPLRGLCLQSHLLSRLLPLGSANICCSSWLLLLPDSESRSIFLVIDAWRACLLQEHSPQFIINLSLHSYFTNGVLPNWTLSFKKVGTESAFFSLSAHTVSLALSTYTQSIRRTEARKARLHVSCSQRIIVSFFYRSFRGFRLISFIFFADEHVYSCLCGSPCRAVGRRMPLCSVHTAWR